MSELILDQQRRMALLKHMILQLHEGDAPETVRPQLIRLLGRVPYDEVVAVEQELIAGGMPVEEILKFCDIHKLALNPSLQPDEERTVPAGHPVDVMRAENRALAWELDAIGELFTEVRSLPAEAPATELVHDLRVRFNALMDVEKHYLRKEHLLFPFLEKHGVTGPPTVMWGKHDETRTMLKNATLALAAADQAPAGNVAALIGAVLQPAVEAVAGMVDKEQQILLPMCLDTLEEQEWGQIAAGSADIGYCLVVPEVQWRPEGAAKAEAGGSGDGGLIRLPSGAFTPAQLQAVLNTIPFDITFVDADDTVRYFSEGSERIFARTRAIIGRKVEYCHPPKSVAIVQQILDDFREGRESHAQFWIELGGKFLCIEYFALRDEQGAFLGTLEVSQNLTAKRALTGQQRLLNYVKEEAPTNPQPVTPPAAKAAAPEAAPADRPAWVDAVQVVATNDARAAIAAGAHPLAEVMAAAGALKAGQAYRLITPFLPAPLLEKVGALGLRVWTHTAGPGEVHSLFARLEG